MITVIAGVNGAGKSSVLGSLLRQQGDDYFNPDEVARMLMQDQPGLSQDQANALAWKKGYDYLADAIATDSDFTFETTLGGHSVAARLHEALDHDCEVRIIFTGLISPELHIQRVAARVQKGGHDIPEAKIRERYHGAIHNMMSLIPRCTQLRVLDNSANLGQARTLFAMAGGLFTQLPVKDMPEWAKPLAAVAVERHLAVSGA